MNTIGYYLRPNPTDTAAQAPYLPKLVPNGDVMTATFTNALGSTTATGEVYNLP